MCAVACRAPYPNDSELYNAIRERVKKEVFKGTEVKGAHRTGSEWAAAVILGYAATAYGLYTWDANPITGVLLGERKCSQECCAQSRPA
jgi:fatty acid desaturase (delta-4 desaturase)